MKRPAVFFDRDNTLIVSDGYLGDPNGVILMDGAPDAIAKVRQYGFKVVTVSNQSGVARGMFDEAAVQRVNARMDELLRASNPRAVIERHEYCPFHPEAAIEQYRQDSPLRKPKPGMLHQAADRLNLDLSKSWLVGDAPRDVEAGKAAGCRTILFTPPGVSASPAAEASSGVEPDFRVSSLKEAVEIIGREAFKRFATAAPPAASSSSSSSTTSAAVAAAPVKPVMLSVPAAAVAEAEPDEHGDVIESANASSKKLAQLATPTAIEDDAEDEPEVAARVVPPRAEPPRVEPAKAEPARVDSPKVEPAIAKAEPPKVEAPKVEAPKVERPAAPLPPQPEPARPAPVQPLHAPAAPQINLAKVEHLLEQLLIESKRRREQPVEDFSISKLLAGLVQGFAVAALAAAYWTRENPTTFLQWIAFALTLQTMTIALLIMGRQK